MKPTTSFPKVIGLCKKGIGALPVGLKGKLYGQPFKVLVQYDAFGGVRAQIYEDEAGGGMITEVAGRAGEVDGKASAFAQWAINRAEKEGLIVKGGKGDTYNLVRYGTGDWRKDKTQTDSQKIIIDIEKRAKLFIKDLHNEVKTFNSSKNPKTVKAKAPVKLGPAPKKPAAKKPAATAPAKKLVTRTIKVKEYCVKSHNRTIRVPAKK